MSDRVPGVRVAKLADRIQAGDKGTVLPADVLGDLMQVTVTRTNTGASQYSATFNNAYLSTARDRANRGSTGASPGPVERMTGDMPFWPRFKYNDFTTLKFGDRLRIDMRYVPGGDGAPAATATDGWVPMIAGPIIDMQFSFAAAQGAQLTVSGEDDLGILRDLNERRREMNQLAEVSIVRRVLSFASFPLQTIASPRVAYQPFMTDDSQGLYEALQPNQSYLEYIQKFADRLDFEVFLEFSKLDTPESPLEFHFEPYRARSPVTTDLTVDAERGRNLLEFKPTIKVLDQYSETKVRGRHRDPQVCQEVVGHATHDVLSDELHPTTGGTLLTGPEVRDTFFPGRPHKPALPNRSNLDQVRADWYANVVIRRKARELFTVDGTIVGQPRLRPGFNIQILGMRPPFDGYYYVIKTVHTFGGDGLRTRFTASRPGMELPAGGQYVE